MKWQSAGLLVFVLIVSGCKERIYKVTGSSNEHFIIFEGRKNGAGPAPDSVKIYVISRSSFSENDRTTIFEGQDVGKVCYRWINPMTLQIAISGGYADRVLSSAAIDGELLRIKYVGTEDSCRWQPTP